MTQLDTDYLIIGAGASGLAFADSLLAETEAHLTIVDRRDRPGGHWNDAYPFVRLHQPSSFYGVTSTPLGRGRLDQSGLNKGFEELATGAEITAYIDIDPHKIGNTISGRPVWSPQQLPEPGTHFVLSYVANRGAREQIKQSLEEHGYRVGKDYLLAG